MACVEGEPSFSGCCNMDDERADSRKKMKGRRFTITPVLRKEIVCDELPLTEYYAVYVEDKCKIGLVLQILPNMPSEANHLKRIKNGVILIQPTRDPLPPVIPFYSRLDVVECWSFHSYEKYLCNEGLSVTAPGAIACIICRKPNHHLRTPDELIEELRTLHSDISVLKVQVPLYKPVTRKQFLWAKQYWPTAFHPNKQDEALLNGNFLTADEYQKIIAFYLESEKFITEKSSSGKAFQISNGGSGCVIVDLNGEVVAKSGSRNIPLGHAVMAAVSDLCERHRTKKSDVIQYLGTGFDVYLTDEPCAMCAMALVHFRVGRVFYGKRTPSGGVYESCWRIQEEKSLNHHYSVFRIDECI